MRHVKIIILSFLAFALMSAFSPVKHRVSNLTKWVCGVDTAKPWVIIYKDNISGEMTSYYIIGGGGSYTPPDENSPKVLVGDDKDLPAGQSTVTLDGSSSYSPGGATPLTYLWEVISGDGAEIMDPTTATTTATGLITGVTYKFKLTVTDANSLSASKVLTVNVQALPSSAYFITDSAAFNFTPYAQNVPGWTDVVGDPTKQVISATASNGIEVSTIGTDTTLWRGDPLHSDSGSLAIGMHFETAGDPFGFVYPKNVTQTGFVNAKSQYIPGTNNMKISGLDPDARYQIRILGSWYDSTNNAADNLSHDLFVVCGEDTTIQNTVFNTSRESITDTVAPNGSGNIFLSVTGIDSTYAGDGGTRPIISGMKIYKVSKSAQSSGITYTRNFYYDTVLSVNDGAKMRPLMVYKPYNYNPSKSYPIVIFFGGGESRTINDQWNNQFITNFGLSWLIERKKGEVYGINANGDTCGFIMIQPEMSLTLKSDGSIDQEPHLSPTQVDNVLLSFKSKTGLNYNDSLYLVGFSSGAEMVTDYVFHRSWKVAGAFIQSPGQLITDYADSISSVIANKVRWWVVARNDGMKVNVDNLLSDIPDSLMYHYYWYRNHTGFIGDYSPVRKNFIYGQTIFDWMVNPSKYNSKWAGFLFYDNGTGLQPGFVYDSTPNYQTANNYTVTTKKSPQGWYITSGDKTLWATGTDAPGSKYVNVGEVENYPKYAGQYETATRTSILRNDAPYSSTPNLIINGLIPNHSYTIQYVGKDYLDSDPPRIATMQWGIQIDTIVTSNFVLDRTHELTGESESNGQIKLGWYKTAASGGPVRLQYIMIREN